MRFEVLAAVLLWIQVCGIWRRVAGFVFPDVSKETHALTFRRWRFQRKWRHYICLDTSRTTNSASQSSNRRWRESSVSFTRMFWRAQSAWYVNPVLCGIETSYTFFFFFSRCYNPWWVLACFTISFHSLLSLHFSLQFLTFIFFKSSSTWSGHLNLGLPTGLDEHGSHSVNFLTVLVLSILITCAAQHNLCEI